MSSFTALCDCERAARIAEMTAFFVAEAAALIRESHGFDGLTLADLRAVVPALLGDRVQALAAEARARPGYTASEEMHVRLSEAQVACKRAVAAVFPIDEE